MERAPSCEDLRVGQTVGGLRVHSPMRKGPFFRVYGADGPDGDWLVYAWEGPPPPSEAAISAFRERAERLAAAAHPGLVPVRGPFSFAEGELGWATSLPVGGGFDELLSQDKVKASVAAPALAQAARALAAALRAGLSHPELRPEHLQVHPVQTRVTGFFSWRLLHPPLHAILPPEEENFARAPEGGGDAPALSFALGTLAARAGLAHAAITAAQQSAPGRRPGLEELAGALEGLRPGLFGRLFGR